MASNYLISDAARQVKVEAHVLRYWEEELDLPIKRNELGHRFYTEADVERFREIKTMKERGLQLKAIRMILKNGKLDMLGVPQPKQDSMASIEATDSAGAADSMEVADPMETTDSMETTASMEANDMITGEDARLYDENREEKAKRLQWLLQQLFRETLQENNKEMCQMMKENILKELDYQFRMQEEKEEERYEKQSKQAEEHYKRIDELLRKKRRLLKK